METHIETPFTAHGQRLLHLINTNNLKSSLWQHEGRQYKAEIKPRHCVRDRGEPRHRGFEKEASCPRSTEDGCCLEQSQFLEGYIAESVHSGMG